MAIGEDLVSDCVRYCASLGVLYLNNPKCACTTVKHALWLASDAVAGRNTFAGNVHDREIDPFARNVFRLTAQDRKRVARATVFSVVRNPFARALSAYVDKVANDPGVWPFFLKGFGLKPDVGKKELPFADFLGLIAVAHDDILDGHFRPQCRNLLLPLARPVFVGFVENMKPLGDFLATRGVRFRDVRMNASRAHRRLDRFYDRHTAVLVRKRYAEDFARFGYSAALADAHVSPESEKLSLGNGSDDPLLCWLATGKPPPGLASRSRSSFAAFNRSRDASKKLKIVRAVFAAEHDWSRLQRYADYAGKKRSTLLREEIRERMSALRRRYVKAVGKSDLFVVFR